MNEIYRVQNLLSNFFVPQYKLKSKVRIGTKIKKTYATLNYFDLQAQREELLARFEDLKKKLNSKNTG